MSIITDFKFPQTDAEVQANRRKFVSALRTSTDQCRFALYVKVEGEDERETKHLRCAIGVAGTVFFGVKTEEDLAAWEDWASGGSSNRQRDIYEAVARMLGIDNEADDEDEEQGVSVDDIVAMNDASDLTFPAIAEALVRAWGQ